MSYTHENLSLVGIHEPESSTDEVAPGQYEKHELPGFFTIGTEVDGVFVPIVRIKAGKLLQDIQRAKDDGYTPPAEPAAAPSAPSANLDAIYARLAALEAAQADTPASEPQSSPPPEQTDNG